MTWLVALVGFLVVLGSLLAIAEAAISRMSRVRALALREEERRNAELLVRIESDPPRYLNSVYLAVMFAQNGSAILVAILAERYYGSIGVTLLSIGFTLLYFVFVEAMSKTWGILHSDRAALALAPFVYVLARLFAWPVRVLIGLANILLPGKGLKTGPFVSEEDIRSMAEVGREEGAIEAEETELIHSIFEFGDTIVREVMVPRPDIIAVEVRKNLRAVMDLVVKHGFSRLPVFRENLDDVLGVVYAKDVLKALHQRKTDVAVEELMRKPHFVPESKKVAELLREMQTEKFHIAIVTDEYGSVSGLVTLEDLLEELVGEIIDEYDREDPKVQPVDENTYRVSARMSIDDLNEILDADLPDTEWDTVGGLVQSILGAIPRQGQEVAYDGFRFVAERVKGRRIDKVLVERLERSHEDESVS